MVTPDLLEQAAFMGDVVELARLLDEGADINAKGRNWNPLHAAIENEQLSCVQLLLARGADPESLADGDLSPLAHAVDISMDGTIQTGGSPGDEPTEIIRLLLSVGANPDSGITVATDYQSVKVVDLLTSAKQEACR